MKLTGLLRQQADQRPELEPLVLVLKQLLSEQNLNEALLTFTEDETFVDVIFDLLSGILHLSQIEITEGAYPLCTLTILRVGV